MEIIFTQLLITSGSTVREGFAFQNIIFDVNLSPDATAGSVSGSNLWKVTVFGSTNSNGVGTRVLESSVVLTDAQSGADVILGQVTQLQGMNAQLNLLDSGVACADIPYFCVLVEKGDSPSPDFFLSRPPTIVCQPLTCRGKICMQSVFVILIMKKIEGGYVSVSI